MTAPVYPIFLSCLPGLESVLADEARALGFASPKPIAGGVETEGGWSEVWRANLWLRGASRVLVRIASFRALHLAQLDKRARKLPWAEILRPDQPLRVEASCTRSRIYHQRAAAQRIERAVSDAVGAKIDPEASLRVMLRIEDDLATLSLDTSGASLHKRGHKQAIGKAPLRETMAALFLRQMGFDGSQPVLDPMCGSGTFVIEAAEIAMRLAPGRARSFAFEDLASFDAQAWAQMRSSTARDAPLQFFGYDRDQGAVQNATANAARAGVTGCTAFHCQPISALTRPETAPGLIMVNPPYGGRIGSGDLLFGLYASLGNVLKAQFSGWRVGLVTSERKLARATGLPLTPGPLLPHGGLKVQLFQSPPL